MAIFTLLDDWVSLVLPPSAAESPEITRALEKLLLPNRRLRVELVEEARLDRSIAAARSCTVSWSATGTAGDWENTDVAELWNDSWLLESLWAISWADVDVWMKGWRLSTVGPEWLEAGGLWFRVVCAWMDWLLGFLLPLKERLS